MPTPDLNSMKLTPEQLYDVEEQAKSLRALSELPDDLKTIRQTFIQACEKHGRTPEDVVGLRLKKKRGRKKSNSSTAREQHAQH